MQFTSLCNKKFRKNKNLAGTAAYELHIFF